MRKHGTQYATKHAKPDQTFFLKFGWTKWNHKFWQKHFIKLLETICKLRRNLKILAQLAGAQQPGSRHIFSALSRSITSLASRQSHKPKIAHNNNLSFDYWSQNSDHHPQSLFWRMRIHDEPRQTRRRRLHAFPDGLKAGARNST